MLNDITQETLAIWLNALTPAFTKAGFSAVFHPSTGSFRMGDLIVRKLSAPDQQYKITFLRKVSMVGTVRTAQADVSLYNPNGGLTVHLRGFHDKKVAKIVGYASKFVDGQIAREATVDAKRRRATVARAHWEAAKIELPDWMTVAPNIDDDKDAGTYHVYLHEHRANFGLQKLSLGQVKRLADFLTALASEPSVEAVEADLATKLLQHEGKVPAPKSLKYDKKADDKQWMHDTLNP